MKSVFINNKVNAYSIKDGDKSIGTYYVDENEFKPKCNLSPTKLMEVAREVARLATEHNKSYSEY